jgi:hypothetical protein
MGQWATPIPHSRPSPLTPDGIAANTFPGADRVFQRCPALGRRIARVLQSDVVERDFEIAATFIAALIIQRDRIDQLRRVVRHRAAIGLAPANAATRVHAVDNGLGIGGYPIVPLTDVSSSIRSRRNSGHPNIDAMGKPQCGAGATCVR